MSQPRQPAPTIYTVGHSTRTLDELVHAVTAHGITTIADVRLIPKSRRHPHFNDDALAAELPRRGLRYAPFKSLGGRRRPAKDSVNTAWRNDSFRGYADFMQTPAFARALEELMALARQTPTAIMCAEAVPWRCHRSLIADALLARGWAAFDVMSPASAPAHKLRPFAVVRGTNVTYPAETLFERPEGG
jgi:uncharacterized protein (DUF488 family)